MQLGVGGVQGCKLPIAPLQLVSVRLVPVLDLGTVPSNRARDSRNVRPDLAEGDGPGVLPGSCGCWQGCGSDGKGMPGAGDLNSQVQ